MTVRVQPSAEKGKSFFASKVFICYDTIRHCNLQVWSCNIRKNSEVHLTNFFQMILLVSIQTFHATHFFITSWKLVKLLSCSLFWKLLANSKRTQCKRQVSSSYWRQPLFWNPQAKHFKINNTQKWSDTLLVSVIGKTFCMNVSTASNEMSLVTINYVCMAHCCEGRGIL